MGASHLFVTAPGRLVGRRRAWRTPMTDEQWALLEPESFDSTTTRRPAGSRSPASRPLSAPCHVHGLTGGVHPTAVCMGLPASAQLG